MLSDTGAGSAGRAPERHPAAAPDHSGEGRGEGRGGGGGKHTDII